MKNLKKETTFFVPAEFYILQQLPNPFLTYAAIMNEKPSLPSQKGWNERRLMGSILLMQTPQTTFVDFRGRWWF